MPKRHAVTSSDTREKFAVADFAVTQGWTAGLPWAALAADPDPAISDAGRALLAAREQVKQHAEALPHTAGNIFDPNYALVNIYRDGRDCILWHADNAHGVVQGSSIGSISLGARRRFVLRPYVPGVRGRTEAWPEVSVLLDPGALLLMGPLTNEFWCHCLPADDSEGTRVKITFRCLLPREDAETDGATADAGAAGSPGSLQTINDSSGANYERLARKHAAFAPGQHPVFDHSSFCKLLAVFDTRLQQKTVTPGCEVDLASMM